MTLKQQAEMTRDLEYPGKTLEQARDAARTKHEDLQYQRRAVVKQYSVFQDQIEEIENDAFRANAAFKLFNEVLFQNSEEGL